MRSLPAIHNNQQFASRLEARLACFLDKAGVRWVYEPEVFDLDELTYIPDFFLADWRCWLEAKGEVVSDVEGLKIIRKCELLTLHTSQPVILCFGDILSAKCAVFHQASMHPARWTMCRWCGGVALSIEKAGQFITRCPGRSEHGAALDVADQRQRSRFLYDAAIQARQTKFSWPRKKAS